MLLSDTSVQHTEISILKVVDFMTTPRETKSDVKFPNSARLFSFCKSVLDSKFGKRVIDQDIGQILKLDPADCSHWKKGRKHIRSIEAVHAIAQHLGVDERLVMDVASGTITDDEALQEYRGLGPFQLPPTITDIIRNDWQMHHGRAWSLDLETKSKALFSINHDALQTIIDEIHHQINFEEPPLFIPELTNAFPNLRLVSKGDDEGSVARHSTPIGRRLHDGSYEVHYQEGLHLRPVGRFQTAKAMAPFFISALWDIDHVAFRNHADTLRTVYGNIFASRLLVPARMLQREMAKINLAKDLVSQLAEIFWVSRSLMNQRLKDILSINWPR